MTELCQKSICYLVLGEGNDARLVGYRLSLSPRERRLIEELEILRYAQAADISAACGGTISEKLVPSVVHRINTKAKEISGRALIINTKCYYCFNRDM